ncbi:hypothetical protein C8J55DRAFT_319816 [Lentinula edodes]|uniref:Uncharacterized protein n=1 Tax=Lentinula lateritia TaxID=40482 RepID=A0A9W9AN39_9AGAR|nr:hypothetical protein C8J55DRAFT_319816 [Lentinula edodes]
MRFEFNTTIFLVVGLASTAYTLPFDTSTPPPGPNITTRAVSLTQPPIESTATGTITFLGTHSGVPLLPHESPKISTAYEEGHIPSDVYTRVRKAVQEVVPEWDAERGGVLAFSNSFEGNMGTVGGMSSGGSRNGSGARGRVVQYGVIEVGLKGIGRCQPAGCVFKIDRNGKVVQGSLVVSSSLL